MSTACIEMASRLGKALAASPQATALEAAHKQLTEDPASRQLLEEYQKQVMQLSRMEQAHQPISQADQQKIQAVNDKLVASAIYKKFLAAQVEYVDLMRKTNQAIRAELPQLDM